MFFVMADVDINWDERKQNLNYCVKGDRFMVFVPLGKSSARVVLRVPEPTDIGNWNSSEFQALINNLGLKSLRIGTVFWKSAAEIRTRIAERFVDGRVALAGDASHAFSPIGGLGMNTGFLDANHLARTIAGLLGRSPYRGSLSDYGVERHRIAKEIDGFTKSLTFAIANDGRDSEGISEFFLPKNRGNEFLTKILPWKVSGLAFKS